MNDQSHKEEMTAALRADFERLRDRGVASTLAPTGATESDELVDKEPPLHEDDAAQLSAGEPARAGWLARLLGR